MPDPACKYDPADFDRCVIHGGHIGPARNRCDRAAAGVTLDPRPDEISDNQAALEVLPHAVQAVDFNLPARVIVDQHGHYWRDYGDFLSMCPVSDENTATEVVASFALVIEELKP